MRKRLELGGLHLVRLSTFKAEAFKVALITAIVETFLFVQQNVKRSGAFTRRRFRCATVVLFSEKPTVQNSLLCTFVMSSRITSGKTIERPYNDWREAEKPEFVPVVAGEQDNDCATHIPSIKKNGLEQLGIVFC